jgi:hypothetical protein
MKELLLKDEVYGMIIVELKAEEHLTTFGAKEKLGWKRMILTK